MSGPSMHELFDVSEAALLSAPADVLEIGIDAAIGNCVEYLHSVALEDAAQQMEAVRTGVAELIAELRNAHEIIKLAMNHVPADARSKWLLAIDDAGLCGDGVTRFHERKNLLARVGGVK